ncbi:flagellar filament capping protein FliD [Alkalicoccus chagannorensis]|uniref:flagellar filament capping protein FliD n=1 Tax=Alkalicoccus chagannorensis TaxID=427072 RepID=UPI000407ECA1|nr:flagellar filament capping protein FliD [Alkalicoccus chagannorensis]
MDGVNRMTGFASGMDINQQVADMMRAERQPLEPMQQDLRETEMKIDEYRDMNRKFLEFDDSIRESMIRTNTLSSREAESSDESLVSASATSAAGEGSYTVSDVSLSQQEVRASDGAIVNDTENFDPSMPIREQLEMIDGMEEGEDLTFAIATFNEAGEQIAREFEIGDNDSMNDVVNGMNNSDLGIQAFFDPGSGQMSIQRSEEGVFNPDEEGEILFGAMDGGEFTATEDGLMTSAFQFSNDDAPVQAASNATFNLNGIDMEQQGNTYSENGLNLTLNQSFEDQSVRIDVAADDDRIFDTVMGFVEDYNELVGTVQEKTNEEYFRDYAPLTDEQRRELDESEVELWEERSNSGLLQRDSILTSGLSSMRQQMYQTVESDQMDASFNQLTEIGITTTSDFRQGGILEVDEDELRASIAEDPDAVENLFRGDGDTPEERGIARRVLDSTSDVMAQIGERAGRTDLAQNESFTLGREFEQQQDRISNFERRMDQVEERYWSQFTRMEQAMAEANNQQQQMMSQMGGMGGQM